MAPVPSRFAGDEGAMTQIDPLLTALTVGFGAYRQCTAATQSPYASGHGTDGVAKVFLTLLGLLIFPF